jgi:multidrug efflux pump subunit AcrB
MILLFGIQSYTDMPKEQYPDASLSQVFINTVHFGNSAEEIESLVTRPLEKELMSLSGIKECLSTSMQDYSVIVAEFDTETSVPEAVLKVKDAVDKAKSELPDDLTQEPLVEEINFSELPIVTVNISGNYSMDELKDYAELVQEKVEALKEISEAEMKGALDREIRIDVDLFKMQSLKVSFGDIENSIRSENLTMSGGEIVKKDFRRTVRIVGQFENVNEVRDIIVKAENQRPILLKDIADVTYGFQERTSYARADGLPVISLDIIKRRGSNMLSTIDNMKDVLDEARAKLPSDITISLFNDLSVNTRNQVSNLENSIISGVILVILILLFFLGLRNSLFVGMAIPLSMLMGILFLYISGTTMNVVVLFSLILALGLLVDNAIVVVENIYRYMQEGYTSKEAAKKGAGEVAWPIIASTATTLAAFLPLAFWPGMMGLFMQYMPITLMLVLGSSLFVALVINPVFTSKFMKVVAEKETAEEKKAGFRNFLIGIGIMLAIAVISHILGGTTLRNFIGIAILLTVINHFVFNPASIAFQKRVLPKLESGYRKFVKFALTGYKPAAFLGGTFVLLILSMMLMQARAPKVEFFPQPDPIYVNVFVELPFGKDIEATNDILRELEEEVKVIVGDRVKIVDALLTQIGENTSDPNAPPEPGATPNKARLTVSFVKYEDRGEISTQKVLDDIRDALKDYPKAKIEVATAAAGPPSGKPLAIDIQGDEVDSLILIADRMIQKIEESGIAGYEELKVDININKPEMLINIDRNASRKYELSTFSISDALRTSIFGKEVSKFKEGENEYPITVRLKEEQRSSISSLINQKITFRNPANGRIVQVPISSVADFEYSSTYNLIRRKDGDRTLQISSNMLEGYNANELNAEVTNLLEDFGMPDGYTFAFAGEQKEQAENMAFLSTALLLAVFMIFIIIVAQFNSVISPFIIILSVLFSTIGVMLGYVFTGMTISVIMTGIGVISLAGVVVNNAIVLVDYINLLVNKQIKKRGVSSMNKLTRQDVKEAIIEGGETRLRPVLLTAMTTMLGLIPLAIGFNFNFFTLVSRFDPQIFIGGDNTAMWGPMAWTIIFGLSFATFLTLIVVPVMYWLAFRLKSGFSNRGKKPELDTELQAV